MALVLSLLGIFTLVFFLLAATNGVKKYVKSPLVKKIATNHRLFGMLAVIFALIHMVVAITLSELRITGALALTSLIVTAMMGMMFQNQKSKVFYMLHRIMGPLTLLLIIIHMVFNSAT